MRSNLNVICGERDSIEIYPSVLNREVANRRMYISHCLLNIIIAYADYCLFPLAEARYPAKKEILYCFRLEELSRIEIR